MAVSHGEMYNDLRILSILYAIAFSGKCRFYTRFKQISIISIGTKSASSSQTENVTPLSLLQQQDCCRHNWPPRFLLTLPNHIQSCRACTASLPWPPSPSCLPSEIKFWRTANFNIPGNNFEERPSCLHNWETCMHCSWFYQNSNPQHWTEI